MVSRKQERNYNRDIKLRTIGVLDRLQSESSFEDIHFDKISLISSNLSIQQPL